MNQAAQVVPLVHAAHLHSIAHPQRHALGEINIVRDQQRVAIADIDNEALVTRAVVVVSQQAPDEASDFDPASVVALFVGSRSLVPLFIVIGQTPLECHKKRGKPFLACRAFVFAGVNLACGNRHHRDFYPAVSLTTRRRTVVRYRTSFAHAQRDQTLTYDTLAR